MKSEPSSEALPCQCSSSLSISSSGLKSSCGTAASDHAPIQGPAEPSRWTWALQAQLEPHDLPAQRMACFGPRAMLTSDASLHLQTHKGLWMPALWQRPYSL